MATIELIGVLAAAIAIYVIYKIRKQMNYFKDRDIPFVKVTWPLGSDTRVSLLRDHLGMGWMRFYDKLAPHKIGGVFLFTKPILMIRDPELVNRIYTMDFSYFVDRGFVVDEKKDPLDGHLFLLNGEKWRYLRAKLSPIFTSGKLKWMFEQMKTCSDKFVDNFENGLDLSGDVDLKEPIARFATDVITSCAFGIETNAIDDPDNEFRKMGKLFFAPTFWNALMFMARMAAGNLLSVLNIKTVDSKLTKFFIDVVKQTFQHRLSTNYVREDFVHLLLELREKGSVQTEEFFGDNAVEKGDNTAVNGPPTLEINDAILTAQLFVFFVAGFETTSSTLMSTIYNLSRNPECQSKAREEAKRVKEKHGDFTYESLKELTYLQNCIDEALRMLPPLSMNMRVANKDYTFPDGRKIEKGTLVLLPTLALHYDPEYYPEPFKFKPERFEGQGPIKGTYAPFGDGPRICIGKRFAEVEMKLTLAKLLLLYNFLPAKKPADLLDYEPSNALSSVPKLPLNVRIRRL